jgi:Tfp pilus assembly protein PilV
VWPNWHNLIDEGFDATKIMLTHLKTNRRRHQRAFTLAEVMLALIVFLMMTLMFAAVFPIAVRAAHYSNDYAQAALLAQHKLDQLRSAGFDKLDYADLAGLGIVDQVPNFSGSSYTFTGVDNLDSFFPSGSSGTIVIADYSSLSNVGSPPPGGNVYVATVTISWPGTGSVSGSYTSSTMIVSMVHR